MILKGVNMPSDNLIKNIKCNEGFKSAIYTDILSFPTVGYGFLLKSLTPDELALNGGKAEPMSKEAADKILFLKLEKLEKEVLETFPWLIKKPVCVQEMVVEMCYQMGVEKVKKFHTTLHHLKNSEWFYAKKSALNSLWARQTPSRAKKVLSVLDDLK